MRGGDENDDDSDDDDMTSSASSVATECRQGRRDSRPTDQLANKFLTFL